MDMKIFVENSVKFNGEGFDINVVKEDNLEIITDAVVLDKIKISDETLKNIRKKVYAILSPNNNVSVKLATEYGIAVFTEQEYLSNFLKFGTTTNSLNYPEIIVSNRKNSIRLLHTHSNVAGVMKELNLIFAYYQINIEAQYLNTLDTIGYVVTDIVASSYVDNLEEAMLAVKGTKKVRVLELK
jgi:D-3-phosphoglycerate dehydrogenase